MLYGMKWHPHAIRFLAYPAGQVYAKAFNLWPTKRARFLNVVPDQFRQVSDIGFHEQFRPNAGDELCLLPDFPAIPAPESDTDELIHNYARIKPMMLMSRIRILSVDPRPASSQSVMITYSETTTDASPTIHQPSTK